MRKDVWALVPRPLNEEECSNHAYTWYSSDGRQCIDPYLTITPNCAALSLMVCGNM